MRFVFSAVMSFSWDELGTPLPLVPLVLRGFIRARLMPGKAWDHPRGPLDPSPEQLLLEAEAALPPYPIEY